MSRLPRSIHFIGAAGRGMAPVMAAMADQGVVVSGSDQPDTFGSTMSWLEQRGIAVARGFSVENLSHNPELIVVGRAYGRGNPEVEAVLSNHLSYASLAEFLGGHVLSGCRNVLVAGSKGKTTTTAMLVEILDYAGLDPGYLIGGFPRSGRTPARFGRVLNVIEADDYSTLWWNRNPKFLYYRPSILVLTNVYPDHSDVHGDHAGSWQHFAALIQQLPQDGLIVLADSRRSRPPSWLLADAPCDLEQLDASVSHSPLILEPAAAAHPPGIQFLWQEALFCLAIPGRVNAMNAIAASVAACHLGVTPQLCAEALEGFQGVEGRMDVFLSSAVGWIYCDCFGYLPESIAENLASLRAAHPGKTLTLVFQLRQIDQLPEAQESLVSALSSCDEVILIPYPRPKITLVAEMDPEYVQSLLHRVRQSNSSIRLLSDIESVMHELVMRRAYSGVTLFSLHSRYKDQLISLLPALGVSV